jgi:phosphoglycerate dehydrogenase-like enzyme
MKIFAHPAAASRVHSALAAHEFVSGDRNAKPDIVWITFEALMGGGIDLFFDVALNSGNTKWVHTQQTGLDSPRYRELIARGIPLTNSHAQAPAIAEHVLANVLAETYPIAAARAAQEAHEWKRMPFRELGDMQWLIVGFGAIGSEIAKRAKSFGATVTGINRSGRPAEFADAMGTLADLPKFLPSADVVVIAAAQTDATTDLVDRDFVAAMKPGSIIVNVARGGLVVDADLRAGLDQGAPGLAILDAFREEPLPADDPYWSHPKVRITSHTSSSGSGTLRRADQFFLDNLKRFERGEPLSSRVTENSF